MNSRQEIAVRVRQVRARAALAGPLHACWDLIFDAEAFLAEQPTLIPWTEEELLEALKAVTI